MEKKIPMLLNNFNVYNGTGNKLVGISSEIALPELTQKVFEIDAAGMLGAFESVAVGEFESAEMDIAYICISKEMFDSLANGANINHTLRGSIQVNEIDGNIKQVGVRIVVRGGIKGLTLGTFKKGEGSASSYKIALSYLKIDYDGENVFELDKINSVYKVNGKDMIADIIKNC